MAKPKGKKKSDGEGKRCKEKAEEENRPLVCERASWRGLKMFQVSTFSRVRPL
jgi:hypothetical protein